MTHVNTVFVVDDHRMFREGVRNCLEQEDDFAVVGEAACVAEALALLETVTPDIILIDIRLPHTSGIELARHVRQHLPRVKILVLSGYDFDQYVRALARIGIDGYLLKDSPQEALVHALREIAAGGAVLPPPIASKIMRSYGDDVPSRRHLWTLTIRELEILEQLSEGLRNSKIAERLKISPRTVETHVSRIISKLGVDGRAEAVRIAIESGILK